MPPGVGESRIAPSERFADRHRVHNDELRNRERVVEGKRKAT